MDKKYELGMDLPCAREGTPVEITADGYVLVPNKALGDGSNIRIGTKDKMLKDGWIYEVKPMVLKDRHGRILYDRYGYVNRLNCATSYMDIDKEELIALGEAFDSPEAVSKNNERKRIETEIRMWIAENDPDARYEEYYCELWKYYNCRADAELRYSRCIFAIGEEKIKKLFE